MANITMSLGDYDFSPVPMMTLSKQFVKNGAGEIIGVLFNMSLRGTLLAYPAGGIVNMDALQDDMREQIDRDGNLFILTCDSNEIIKCYPRVTNIQFDTSGDNWVFTCPYTIELEFDDDLTTVENKFNKNHLQSLSESWEIEFNEDSSYYNLNLPSGAGLTDRNPYFLRLSHNVSAQGRTHYVSGVGVTGTTHKLGWEAARDAVLPLLGYDSGRLAASGVYNISPVNYGAFNHMRTNSVDESDGSFSVTESWLICNSGSGIPSQALEDFTVDIRTSIDNDRTSVSINGNIQGLEQRTYGTNIGDFNVTKTKYSSAEDYWNIVKHRLYYRCKYAASGSVRDINILPIATTVGHSPSNGTINYTYDYDDRPSNCVSGALSESLTITDTNPTDVFASLGVIGRGLGPILQNMNTTNAPTREVSVELVMPAATGCPTSGNGTLYLAQNPRLTVYNTLILGIYQDLTSTYDNVYKHQDTETWNPKEGRYTRNIAWTYGDCT